MRSWGLRGEDAKREREKIKKDIAKMCLDTEKNILKYSSSDVSHSQVISIVEHLKADPWHLRSASSSQV